VLPASAAELREYEQEYEDLEWFHDAYADRVAEIHEAGVATDTTHWRDGVTLYVVCRALEVETVVETGVLFGSFDAHVLAAMCENGGGTLHAVDLPGGPPGPFEYGHLIPDRCRDRWELHRGDAREVLPGLLERVGPWTSSCTTRITGFRTCDSSTRRRWVTSSPVGSWPVTMFGSRGCSIGLPRKTG